MIFINLLLNIYLGTIKIENVRKKQGMDGALLYASTIKKEYDTYMKKHPDSLYADFAKQMIEKEEQYQGDDRE